MNKAQIVKNWFWRSLCCWLAAWGGLEVQGDSQLNAVKQEVMSLKKGENALRIQCEQALIPVPQSVDWQPQTCELTAAMRLAVQAGSNLNHMRQELLQALRKKAPAIAETQMAAREKMSCWLTVLDPSKASGEKLLASLKSPTRPESYVLRISPQGVALRGADAAGLYYGSRTLLQLLAAAPKALPCVEIQDYPDLAWRGYGCFFGGHYFIKNPENVPRYRGIVDRMTMAKMNVLAFESEEFSKDEDLEAFGRYCRERFVEPVPVYPYLCLNFPRVVALVKASPEEFKTMMEPVDRAVRLLHPRCFSIAGDELVAGYDAARRGSIYKPEELAEHPAHEWFSMALKRLYGYLKSKDLRMCMWADGFIDPAMFRGQDLEIKDYSGGAPDYHARALKSLPKDVLLWDWQYGVTRAYATMEYFLNQGFQMVGGSIMTDASERLYPEYARRRSASDRFRGMMSMTWCGKNIDAYRKPMDIENCGDAYWSVGKYRSPLRLADQVRPFLEEKNPLRDIPAGKHVVTLAGPGVRFALNSAGRLYMAQGKEGFGAWHPTMKLVTDVWYEVTLQPGATVRQATLDLELDGQANCQIGVAETPQTPLEKFQVVKRLVKGKPGEAVELTTAVAGKNRFCFWLRITDNEDYKYIRKLTVTLDNVAR